MSQSQISRVPSEKQGCVEPRSAVVLLVGVVVSTALYFDIAMKLMSKEEAIGSIAVATL